MELGEQHGLPEACVINCDNVIANRSRAARFESVRRSTGLCHVGGNVLNTAVMSGQFFGYDVVASLSIPSFHSNFDTATGSISNDDLDAQFRAALATLDNANGDNS